MLANVGASGEKAILALINCSWLTGRLPSEWKAADIQPLPKPKEPTKPRPISLMSCTAKTAERMVLTRLQWRLGPFHPHVFGFTKGVGTSDSIMALMSLVDNRPAVAVFLDLEKAFELACAHAILAALVQKGIQGRLLAWIENYLQHRRARVRFQGHGSHYRELENGTPQGGILSPSLFNLLMEQLVSLPFREGVALLSYADDLVLVVTGRDDRIVRAQQALDLVSEKCRELGLKISAEKSKAMTIKAATPDCHLLVQDVRLPWTRVYQYLGVWIDRGLTFTTQVKYLRERTQARVNVMRAMTRTHAGASYAVLRLFYVQAVRALLDYSAPVLIALSPTQQKRIEVIQNRAMRTMLGAPRWTSGCIMQSEARLVPLTTRTQQIVACRVAKILHQVRESAARTKLSTVLPQGHDLSAGNTWLRRVAEAANHLLDLDQLLQEGPDRPAAFYVAPPPWQAPTVEVVITALPASKALCTRVELRQHALRGIADANVPGSAVYYTDGSVDPERGTTGAAVVTGQEVLSWRTPDHCSTLQTELVAIQHALEHARHRREEMVVVHSDSRSALQVLQQLSPPTDNVRLTTTILGLAQRIAAQGRHVRLNWVPSHHSIQQGKTMARRAAANNTEQQHREMEASSRQAAWYAKATAYRPLLPARQLSRADEVKLHRLRLGYRTLEELRDDFESRQCDHCGHLARHPLRHYLLSCPATAQLRQQIGGPEDDEDRAALVLRRALEDLPRLLVVVRSAPPPR
ncbi:putative RNA-directed DNA polymerase from transposon BS [Chionoecetes opilio]|uniref:Putative RNA-directed DNA polymerase from transposon BS n=1 Tax=Chionoecetes opilio TaxID=41210 RepID=A0A8J4Y1F6_CHIOP|nr:putative RNA-directed DNA polymerase from transposon BS [Chionoecetes opilio]